MAENNKPKMSDIVSKDSRPQPKRAPRAVKKDEPKERNIPIKKKEIASREKVSQFFEPKKKEIKVKEPRNYKGFIASGGAVALLVVLFFGVKAFAVVEVLITPRQSFADVSSSLTASSDSVSDLSMEIVSANDSIEVQGDLEESSGEPTKAQGRIVIFNAFSTQSQQLVEQTRFEAPGGKIYRIQKSVTIPGGKMNGAEMVPGQLEVTVVADKAGTEYNLGLSDFTVPGFKGSTKYEKIYARSKTEMTGGSVGGGGKIVTQAAIDNILAGAGGEMKKKIKEKIQRDLPEGIFIPDEAIEIDMAVQSVEPQINSQADTVKIVANAQAKAMVLRRSELSEALAAIYLDRRPGEAVDVQNLESLNFEILSSNFDEKTLSMRITGKAHFVWLSDHDQIKKDLTNSSRDARAEVFKNYSGVERAEIKFKPSWFRFFPSNPDKIDVRVILGQNS